MKKLLSILILFGLVAVAAIVPNEVRQSKIDYEARMVAVVEAIRASLSSASTTSDPMTVGVYAPKIDAGDGDDRFLSVTGIIELKSLSGREQVERFSARIRNECTSRYDPKCLRIETVLVRGVKFVSAGELAAMLSTLPLRTPAPAAAARAPEVVDRAAAARPQLPAPKTQAPPEAKRPAKPQAKSEAKAEAEAKKAAPRAKIEVKQAAEDASAKMRQASEGKRAKGSRPEESAARPERPAAEPKAAERADAREAAAKPAAGAAPAATEARTPDAPPPAPPPLSMPAPPPQPAAAPARNASSQTELAARFPTQAPTQPPAKAPAIELNDRPDQVLQIQLALKRFGYDPGRADNLVGRKTRAAILAYQRQNGLEATGDPSGALLKHLTSREASTQQHAHNEIGSAAQPAAGSLAALEAGGRVAQIQLALQRFGYDPGRVDNVVGRKTRSAILAYQRRNGLEPTGEPSLELLDHLRSTSNQQNTP